MDASGAPAALLVTAGTIGIVHTLLGPDHYLPFVALARSRDWSLRRTWMVTAICGIGHVLGSIVLGLIGIGLGWAVGSLVHLERLRGAVAGWLLLGFGLAYLAWGLRQGLLNRTHAHAHAHSDGEIHRHGHDHHGEHAHPHFAEEGTLLRQALLRRWLGPWTLFVVFVLGPCEPLIPVLMYPAAGGHWFGVAAAAGIFAVTTVSTMLGVVTLGALGLSRLPSEAFERWSHALAGAALALCGLAVTLGF